MEGQREKVDVQKLGSDMTRQGSYEKRLTRGLAIPLGKAHIECTLGTRSLG